jgi:hypothetical protein
MVWVTVHFDASSLTTALTSTFHCHVGMVSLVQVSGPPKFWLHDVPDGKLRFSPDDLDPENFTVIAAVGAVTVPVAPSWK